MNVVSLSCRQCNAPLQINEDMEQLACGHCGAHLKVERGGGTISLQMVEVRFKDQEDAVFLLSRKGLVNRSLIKEKIIKHISREAWGLARHGYQRWYDMADGRTRDEERNEAEGYIDS